MNSYISELWFAFVARKFWEESVRWYSYPSYQVALLSWLFFMFWAFSEHQQWLYYSGIIPALVERNFWLIIKCIFPSLTAAYMFCEALDHLMYKSLTEAKNRTVILDYCMRRRGDHGDNPNGNDQKKTKTGCNFFSPVIKRFLNLLVKPGMIGFFKKDTLERQENLPAVAVITCKKEIFNNHSADNGKQTTEKQRKISICNAGGHKKEDKCLNNIDEYTGGENNNFGPYLTDGNSDSIRVSAPSTARNSADANYGIFKFKPRDPGFFANYQYLGRHPEVVPKEGVANFVSRAEEKDGKIQPEDNKQKRYECNLHHIFNTFDVFLLWITVTFWVPIALLEGGRRAPKPVLFGCTELIQPDLWVDWKILIKSVLILMVHLIIIHKLIF